MNKYIEIIRDALEDIYADQPYWESINEETTLRVIAAIDSVMSFIPKKFVDQREYDEFMFKIYPYKDDKEIHNIFKTLEDYHKESLGECAKDPAWKKFDNGMDSG